MSHSGFQDRPGTTSAPVSGELLGAEEGPRPFTPTGHVDIIRLLSRWTDSVFEIPGLGWRFGLDPILGLVPFAGDIATSVISLYILMVAKQMDVPRSTLLRMGLNVGIDYVVGAIPLVGNLFDFAWKANEQNLKLLERSIATPQRERRKQSIWDWVIVGGIGVAIVGAAIGSLALALFLAGWLLDAVRGR
jgi:hypothetical protein